MAKTSMVVKNHRKAKYSSRAYTRCERCGRPHAVISKFKLVVFVSVNWHIRDKFQALKKQAGNLRIRRINSYDDRSNCGYANPH